MLDNEKSILIWNDPIKYPPPDRVFVLTKSPSGYGGCKWVYRTARKCKDYHSNEWITEGNDDLMDEGLKPIAWSFIDHNNN